MNESLVYIVGLSSESSNYATSIFDFIGFKSKSFKTGNEFIKSYKQSIPSCVLIDIEVPFDIDKDLKKLYHTAPPKSGLLLQAELVELNIDLPVILAAKNPTAKDMSRAFRAGALDFIEKPFKDEILVSRVVEAIKVDRFNIEKNSENIKTASMLDSLSQREYEIISYLAKGFAHKKIGKFLNISFRTVEAHTSRIKLKTQMSLPELTSAFIYSNYSR